MATTIVREDGKTLSSIVDEYSKRMDALDVQVPIRFASLWGAFINELHELNNQQQQYTVQFSAAPRLDFDTLREQLADEHRLLHDVAVPAQRMLETISDGLVAETLAKVDDEKILAKIEKPVEPPKPPDTKLTLEAPPYGAARRTIIGDANEAFIYYDVNLDKQVAFTDLTPTQVTKIVGGGIRTMAMVVDRMVVPPHFRAKIEDVLNVLEQAVARLHVETQEIEQVAVRGGLIGELVMGFTKKPVKPIDEEEEVKDEREPEDEEDDDAPAQPFIICTPRTPTAEIPVVEPPPKKERKKHNMSPEARARAADRMRKMVQDRHAKRKAAAATA